jgi:hypothetical protein
MSLYTDIVAAVIQWTSRPDLTAETDLAIRQAVRSAHKAGTFYRDLATVSLTGLATDQIQAIDLSTAAPDYRKLAYVKPTNYDLKYEEVGVLDLFDQDKYLRSDVFYVVGNTLNIRAASPSSTITLVYYRNPTLTPLSALDSWIATNHQDLIVCWAAAAESLFATGH